MWGWYLEWSTIARTEIKDGRLLRYLGFGRRRGSATGEEEELGAEDPPEDPPAEPGWHRDAHTDGTEEPGEGPMPIG